MCQLTSISCQILVLTASLFLFNVEAFAKNTSASVPKALLKASVIKKACGTDRFGGDNKVSFVATLDRKARLYKIICNMAAYNIREAFYVVKNGNKRKPILQHFYQYTGTGKRSRVKTLVNAYYDKKTRKLSSFHKYMGAGLCGHSGDYKWIGTGFKLKKFLVQERCDPGKISDHWPVIYPKKK